MTIRIVGGLTPDAADGPEGERHPPLRRRRAGAQGDACAAPSVSADRGGVGLCGREQDGPQLMRKSLHSNEGD